MEFHTFGDPSRPAMLLIHGVLTPWQIWEPMITRFQQDYHVIVPALDAHIEEYASEFESIEAEVLAMEQYVTAHCGGRLAALCGLSMGGVIANRLFERTRVHVECLVLDGAPLLKMPKLAAQVMTSSYLRITRKSKARDPKTLARFKRDFLPERYLEPYLNFADTMSEASVRNMIASVCSIEPQYCENPDRTRILFLQGDAGNEKTAVKSAALMKRNYPEMSDRNYTGMKHTELAVLHPADWCRDVEAFLKQKNEE